MKARDYGPLFPYAEKWKTAVLTSQGQCQTWLKAHKPSKAQQTCMTRWPWACLAATCLLDTLLHSLGYSSFSIQDPAYVHTCLHHQGTHALLQLLHSKVHNDRKSPGFDSLMCPPPQHPAQCPVCNRWTESVCVVDLMNCCSELFGIKGTTFSQVRTSSQQKINYWGVQLFLFCCLENSMTF